MTSVRIARWASVSARPSLSATRWFQQVTWVIKPFIEYLKTFYQRTCNKSTLSDQTLRKMLEMKLRKRIFPMSSRSMPLSILCNLPLFLVPPQDPTCRYSQPTNYWKKKSKIGRFDGIAFLKEKWLMDSICSAKDFLFRFKNVAFVCHRQGAW